MQFHQWYMPFALSVAALLLLDLVVANGRGHDGLESDRHYVRHMLFRHDETERRIEQWHETLRHRGHERRMSFRQELQASGGHGNYVGSTDPGDREVLVDLYRSTAGSGWTNNKGWTNSSSDPCSTPWAGVYCQGDRVVSIELVYNNMAGPLPQSIGKLTKLQQLVFYSNMLTGEIPESVFSLPSLTELDLNNNQLTGSLPSSIAASKLQHLVLYTNQLTGPLATSWVTPHLLTLEISSNAFTGPAPEGLSSALGLRELVISRNNFSGDLPESWGRLSNLTQLWAFNNELKSPLPSSWAGMRSLQNVELDSVTGPMPSWIGNWNKISLLNIVRGQLSGELPAGICQWHRIQTLWLFQNELTGSLPSCIGDWTNIQQLEISDNRLSGDIPEGIERLQQLQFLYLSRNNLDTTLPAGLGKLKNLQIMDLSSNQLVGGIPTSFNALAGVMSNWALCYNKLSGPLTEELAPLFKAIGQFSCELYSNPWQCPVPSIVPKECGCECDKCNTQSQRLSCTACVAATQSDAECGYCQEDTSQLSSCLQGSSPGPSGSGYKCQKWHFGSASNCSAVL